MLKHPYYESNLVLVKYLIYFMEVIMPDKKVVSEFAQNLAKSQNTAVRYKNKFRYPDIGADHKELLRIFRAINNEVKKGGDVLPAAEWFLDNYFIIEEQAKVLRQIISIGQYKNFPMMSGGKLRIGLMADALIIWLDGRLNRDLVEIFLKEYQEITPLDSRELWYTPMALRIALIKRIRVIAQKLWSTYQLRKIADRWAAEFIDVIKEGNQDEIQNAIKRHDYSVGVMESAYVERLLKVLREYGSEAAPLLRWVDGKLAIQGMDADEVINMEHQNQAAWQLSMGNAITSLRIISSIQWDACFERLSRVEGILRREPAGIYSQMDFKSRDYYRSVVEKLACKYKKSEVDVAAWAVECAKNAQLPEGSRIDGRIKHVGYYLIDDGIDILKGRLKGVEAKTLYRKIGRKKTKEVLYQCH